MKISPLALMVSVFGLAVFSLYKIEGLPKSKDKIKQRAMQDYNTYKIEGIPKSKDKIKSQHAVQDYDTIKIQFPDLKEHYPNGRQSPIQGIVLHAPEIPSVYETISVLQKRSVGCHYIIPNTTLSELKKEAKALVAQQKFLPKSEKLSPVALKACHAVLRFKGRQDRIPVLQLADDHTGVKQAGLGQWKDWTCDVDGKLNSATIGIECANSPNYKTGTHDLFRYSVGQMQVLIPLLQGLVKKHKLVGSAIVAHSDIAWDRPGDVHKKDPGPWFSYETLARYGLGLVPLAKDFPPLPEDRNNQKDMISWIQTCFHIMGYRPCPVTGKMDTDTLKIIRAYALHFFPECPAYKKGYDFGPLVHSLLHHPWAPYVLTKEDHCQLSTGIETIPDVLPQKDDSVLSRGIETIG